MGLELGEPTLRDVCGRFLADRSRSCSHRTIRAYEKACRLILVPALGELAVGAISRRHVLDVHAIARDTNGPAAANMAVVVGRMVWRWAIDELLVGDVRNPFDRIKPWSTPRRRNPATPEQGQAVWRVCEAALQEVPGNVCRPEFGAYFQLLLLTGLRMREGTHLRHEEFDRPRGELCITRHKTSASTGAKRITLSRAARSPHRVRAACLPVGPRRRPDVDRREVRNVSYTPNTILTGSYVYGDATDDSDVDLVVYVDKATQQKLCKLFPDGDSDYDGVVKTIRCGRLQLLLVTDETALRAWQTFTRAMEAMKPVSREQAKAAGEVIRGHMWPRGKSG